MGFRSLRGSTQLRTQRPWDGEEEEGDTHGGGQRVRLQEEAAPPALGKGLACCLPGTRSKPSVSSEQAATHRKHQKGSQATPA